MLNIKTIAKQNKIYSDSWSAICIFIEEDVLAAFIAGLKHPYFGYAQAAKPENIESAYAFLCKFTANEKISSRLIEVKNQKTAIPNRTMNSYAANAIGKNIFTNTQGTTQPNVQTNFPRKTQYKAPTEKMEVDTSTKSRFTTNKNFLNNNEIPLLEAEASSCEEDDILTNFWEVATRTKVS